MAVEGDWEFLRAALPDLREYILSPEVYWTLRPAGRSSAGARIPQLTIGNLLLSRARLAVFHLDEKQQAEFTQISQGIQQVREEWRSNWSLKAGKEFSARLNQWQQYVRELRGDVRQHAAEYPNQVRARAILRLLGSEMLEAVPPNETAQLDAVDQVVRGLSQPGSFIWEPEVSSAFSPDNFWFLYVQFR